MLAVIRRDVALLSEEEVPHLIKESSTAQVTKILRGDYNLKIARQDYFTSNQDQVRLRLIEGWLYQGCYCSSFNWNSVFTRFSNFFMVFFFSFFFLFNQK